MNPPRYSDAVEVANVWGVRAICAYNDHRPRIVSVRAGVAEPTNEPKESDGRIAG